MKKFVNKHNSKTLEINTSNIRLNDVAHYGGCYEQEDILYSQRKNLSRDKAAVF